MPTANSLQANTLGEFAGTPPAQIVMRNCNNKNSTILNDSVKHDNISVPSLVIFAIPHMKEAWMTKSPDQKVRADAQIYFTKIDSLATKQAKAFEDGVPTGHVMKLKSMHYIYISNESEILNAIRKFGSKLK